jgi:hypothetical protein
VRLV